MHTMKESIHKQESPYATAYADLIAQVKILKTMLNTLHEKLSPVLSDRADHCDGPDKSYGDGLLDDIGCVKDEICEIISQVSDITHNLVI